PASTTPPCLSLPRARPTGRPSCELEAHVAVGRHRLPELEGGGGACRAVDGGLLELDRLGGEHRGQGPAVVVAADRPGDGGGGLRSEEHTSELQSRFASGCR